ncbi:hypothetical protein QR680_012711 [Steinernema hermaphroditum]|uniref:CBF1-interacting co-repressor CIR N-terminal domain-containing protein n=1 Tax=Steinernema hermaphroditum TaxID=289476 RepID=A0AA39I491_9BILA|nr:hypothetical protein QR680_012711 [Steinernema hermaphroditum]
MGDDGDKIGWMYEGTKAIVNREDYLLGKKIDKNFELYSDVFEKDKDEDRLKHLEQSSVDACKGEAGTSKVSSLQIDVVRTEDPLRVFSMREEQRRREFIENPLNKLKYEKMMRKAFEEMKKAAAEAGDEKKKKSRKDKKKKKKRRDSTSSDEEPEAESKLKGWDSEESSPEKKKNRSALLDDLLLRRRRRHSPAESKRRGSSPAERRDSPARRWRRRVSSSPESHHRKHSDSKRSVHSRDHDRKSRRERRRSRSASPKRQHRPSDRRRRSRSGSPEFRSRDEKKVEKKKPRLTDAEREAKRLEMMSNAKWRDDLRTKNVTMAATDDQKELDNENGKVANFIKPLVHSVTDNMTVEDKLRVKRKQLQSSHGYMDKL